MFLVGAEITLIVTPWPTLWPQEVSPSSQRTPPMETRTVDVRLRGTGVVQVRRGRDDSRAAQRAGVPDAGSGVLLVLRPLGKWIARRWATWADLPIGQREIEPAKASGKSSSSMDARTR